MPQDSKADELTDSIMRHGRMQAKTAPQAGLDRVNRDRFGKIVTGRLSLYCGKWRVVRNGGGAFPLHKGLQRPGPDAENVAYTVEAKVIHGIVVGYRFPHKCRDRVKQKIKDFACIAGSLAFLVIGIPLFLILWPIVIGLIVFVAAFVIGGAPTWAWGK